ncbi:MAG: TM2 domain-containing protein [Oscillospiraceae bacterium]|nr:TM2 domain-containing protein [Oscillospiraceae bacterium]
MQGVNRNAAFAQPNTFQQGNTGQYYGTVTYKSKTAAGVLGILLGAFGAHNFYLGYTSKAVVQLVMTLLSCGFLGVVSGIWGFVEGIMLLTGKINQDGKGLPLKD